MTDGGEAKAIAFRRLDAARRQINTAIWLWFNQADIVSVHTLAAAAHRAILGLSGNAGTTASPFDTAKLPKGVTATMLKQAPHFLEAEPSDPDEMIHLNPLCTELYLFQVVSAYTEFAIDDDSYHPLMSAFMLRLGICRPEVFRAETLPNLNRGLDVEKVKKLSRSDFLKEMFGTITPPPP
jgi:hypothetical protein